MDTQDKKADKGKPIVINGVLLKFPRAMIEVAKASEIGLIKYDVPLDDRNYQGSSYLRYLDPIGRHLIGHTFDPVNIEKGGKLPPEGVKVLHLAQAAWCALAALENYLIEQEKNVNP